MSKYHPFGGTTYNLGSSIGSTDTTILLSSFLEPVTGTPYTMALLNTDIAFATIAPKTTSSEFISFTGITQNSNGTATLTGVTRGLAKKYPFTEDSTYKLPHSGGTQFIISDAPQVFEEYASLPNDNIFTGYNTVPDPINSTDIANKEWVLSVVNGGAVSFGQVTIAGTAGETFSAGAPVYLKASDSRWYKVLANDNQFNTLASVQMGIALSAGSAGATITSGVAISGTVSTLSGLTANNLYYVSDTGTLATTAGTYSIPFGFATATTTLVLKPGNFPTPQEKAAMGGSQGIPTSANKFITQDNVSISTTDQSQTTQNSSSTVGEANTTGLRNKLAQSFIPTKTKIRGVKLYKSADTGTFTGTVTVALYADSAGSPTGSALATVTLTNAQYVGSLVGEFTATFSAEYSMTVGSLYWIQITTSTSDTSNHPNLGINTAGGYASGSVKYFNTPDTNWVAVANIDLYFKTLEGNASQVVKTDSSGLIPSDFLTSSNLPTPAFCQTLDLSSTTDATASSEFSFGSNSTGSVFYFQLQAGSRLYRFARDSVTGLFLETHNPNTTMTTGAGDQGGIVVIGSFIYLFGNDGTNVICSRFSATDLTGEQVMTVPTVACTGDVGVYTDGANVYVTSTQSATTTRKWSLSGTTFSALTTATTANLNSGTSFYDGNNIYFIPNSTSDPNIYKLSATDGSSKTTTTKKINAAHWSANTTITTNIFILGVDTTKMYMGFMYQNYNILNGSSIVGEMIYLLPISKP